MQVNRVSRQADDGTWVVELQLTAEQATFLLNFALGVLIQEGTVTVFDLKAGEQVPENEMAKEFLENLDPNKLHKA